MPAPMLLLLGAAAIQRGGWLSHGTGSRMLPQLARCARATRTTPFALEGQQVEQAHAQPPDEMAGAPSATVEILSFAIPVLGACLAEPLLSMIDTLCIGRLSHGSASAALAALGVNAAIFNVVTCSTAFLCTASTAVIGSLPAEAEHASNDSGDGSAPALQPLVHSNQVSCAFADGMLLAVLLGLMIGTITQMACGPLLARFYHLQRGTAVYGLATSYLRIRALAAPAATATLVGAGIAFGLGDSRTPLFAVLAAMIINLAGDIFLVPRFGLVGAAIATASATWAGAITLSSILARRLRPVWRLPQPKGIEPFLR